MTYDAIIVGAGVAGLTAAAYLGKAGRSVLLCEKENSCGGLVNSFKRKGFIYDGGIRALENAGALFPMLKQLGLELDLVKNKISIGLENQIIPIECDDDLEDYAKLLKHYYPESETDIDRIAVDIERIMEYMDIQYGIDNPLFLDMQTDREYMVKEVLPWIFRYIKTVGKVMALNQPVEEYLKDLCDNQALLDIITQHFFTATPAFFALSYIKLYQDYYYPKGGTGVMAQTLLDFVHQQGVEVKIETEIQQIDIDNRTVTDTRGKSYSYHNLIWTADQKYLYNNIRLESVKNRKVRERIRARKDSLATKKGNNSVFTLYLAVDLEPEYFSKITNAHLFYTPKRDGQSKAGPIPNGKNWQEIQNWLENFLELTTYEISIPVLSDSSMAPKGKTSLIISLLFDFSLTKRIQELGKYEEFRKKTAMKMITILDQTVFPGIAKKILDQFTSTPLTIEKITGSSEGAITGWSFTNQPIPAENRLARIASSVKTPIPNVSQAGQWTYSPSGFPIALITGKLAADRVLHKLKSR